MASSAVTPQEVIPDDPPEVVPDEPPPEQAGKVDTSGDVPEKWTTGGVFGKVAGALSKATGGLDPFPPPGERSPGQLAESMAGGVATGATAGALGGAIGPAIEGLAGRSMAETLPTEGQGIGAVSGKIGDLIERSPKIAQAVLSHLKEPGFVLKMPYGHAVEYYLVHVLGLDKKALGGLTKFTGE